MAAPVGVTRSPPMPSSCDRQAVEERAVAGAGTGSMPCAVATRPRPSGSGCRRPAPSAQRARSAGGGRRRRDRSPSRRSRGNAPARPARRGRGPRPRRAAVDGAGTGRARAGARSAPARSASRMATQMAVMAVHGAVRCLDRDPGAGERRGRRSDALEAMPSPGSAGRPRSAVGEHASQSSGKASSMARHEHVAGDAADGSRWMWRDARSGRRMDRDDIGSFGDDGDARVAVPRDARRPRRRRRSPIDFDAGDAPLLGVEAVGVELTRPTRIDFSCISVCHSSTSASDLAVDARRGSRRAPSATSRRCASRNSASRSPPSRPSDDQRAARLEDVERRHHALDRLVVGLVERIAGGGGDDGLEAPATGTSA